MELSKTIRRLRAEKGWSQEALAERAYVSRQTVSNWETEKSFPDVHSLLILSDLFGISLDEMVKGDVAAMKETVKNNDIKIVSRLRPLSLCAMLALIIIPTLLTEYGGEIGLIFGCLLAGALSVIFFLSMHRQQQIFAEHDIQTKRELLAFLNGKTLDEIEKEKEQQKRKKLRVEIIVTAAIAGATTVFALGYAAHILRMMLH